MASRRFAVAGVAAAIVIAGSATAALAVDSPSRPATEGSSTTTTLVTDPAPGSTATVPDTDKDHHQLGQVHEPEHGDKDDGQVGDIDDKQHSDVDHGQVGHTDQADHAQVDHGPQMQHEDTTGLHTGTNG
jgi:hypothetical protein